MIETIYIYTHIHGSCDLTSSLHPRPRAQYPLEFMMGRLVLPAWRKGRKTCSDHFRQCGCLCEVLCCGGVKSWSHIFRFSFPRMYEPLIRMKRHDLSNILCSTKKISHFATNSQQNGTSISAVPDSVQCPASKRDGICCAFGLVKQIVDK